MLNVKDPPYNAKGDGKADDRLAIQKAIDRAAGQVDHTVFIPAGTYKIGTTPLDLPPDSPPKPNAPLVIPSNIRLIGEGIGQTILKLPDNASQNAPWGSQHLGIESPYADHLATLLVNSGNIWWFGDGISHGLRKPEPTKNIEIANMTLDGNNTFQPDIYNVTCHTSKGSAMFISAACALSQQSDAYLHDLELCNAADSGLDLRAGLDTFESGVTNSRFERLSVHHNGWAAVSISGEARNLWFDSCTFEENTNQAVAITFS